MADAPSTRAVAVFRNDYSRPECLVGRCAGLEAPPLVPFRGSEMRSAVVLDPQVTRELRLNKGSRQLTEVAPPTLRDEYSVLGPMLSSEEANRMRGQPTTMSPESSPTSIDEVGHSRAFADVAADVLEVPPAPTEQWMTRLRRALEHPAAGGELLLAILQHLDLILAGQGSKPARAVTSNHLHQGLTACVRRAGSPGCPEGVDLSIGLEACRIIGLSSTEDRRAAAAYYRFGVVPSLCDVMQRWPSHERLQRTAVYALRHVLEDPDAAVEALCIGGPRLVSRAAETHPGFEDLEHNSSKAVQLMSKHRRRWVQESEAPRSGLPSPESDSGAPIQPLMQHVRPTSLALQGLTIPPSPAQPVDAEFSRPPPPPPPPVLNYTTPMMIPGPRPLSSRRASSGAPALRGHSVAPSFFTAPLFSLC